MLLASALGVLWLTTATQAPGPVARCQRSLADFPTEKLLRPLTSPAGTGSASGAGVYVGAFAGAGSAHLADFTLGYAVAPACGLELAVETRHALAPAGPFEAVGASLTVALRPGLALSLGNTARLGSSSLGLSSVGTWVGLPLRLPLTRWLGVVGLDRVAGVDLLWIRSGGGRIDAFVALPAGLLVQALPRLSVQLVGRPQVVVLSTLRATVSGELELLFVPLRWLDLRALAVVSPLGSTTKLDASLGATVRF